MEEESERVRGKCNYRSLVRDETLLALRKNVDGLYKEEKAKKQIFPLKSPKRKAALLTT